MKTKLLLLILIFGNLMFSQQKTILRFENESSTVSMLDEKGTSQDYTLSEAESKFGKINEKVSFGLT